ncbi:Gluconate 2-dehydrogenase, membrane-bound, gamma subunit [Rhodovulum sp. PH10]|uniref:gluconate 2-dehydrogenase subunit 3 family protein n=1 Tax=Rhodovulum sp. PH10 TaxID=1187851 RepID=UPI00027C283C|nr:gluconate 2-dehydrogenase subunit 3 family protein [Rhodovulum sp. PH10]EJW13663.1 Gluconate 2-dehydrogenase, membrane-bound, gamma subunit [Rhodovulum sp. PH10]
MSKADVSRRTLLTIGALVGAEAGLDTLPAGARTYSREVPWQPGEANAPVPAEPGGYRYLSPAEATCLDAMVARLIPADDTGPGAVEAGVTTFIDRQLDGPYGRAQRWYMQGPWQTGSDGQGYQTRLTPAQLYRAALADIDAHCTQTFDDKTFSALAGEQQDELLTALEKDTLALPNAPAKTFFDLLLQNTIEGFFSDPLYGGNRDMVGWKLIGFPGARYDYRPYVGKHNQRLDLPPVGILGRPGWQVGD